MIRVGATLSPWNKGEIARLSLDFIEVKNIEPEFLEYNADILSRFPIKSMHVQYLPSFGQRPDTLNLASRKTLEIFNDENSPLYKAYQFLKPSVISLHLGFSSEEVGTEGVDNHNFAIKEILSGEKTFERISTSLSTISSKLRKTGYKGEILIENLDYHPTGAYEHICEPSFIVEIVKHTGCLVLLDVAHTIISCHYFGIHATDFVRAIGINSIYEIHVNSPLYEDGGWYDINKPFYRLSEAKELIRFIAVEKASGEDKLLLNVECDEEIYQQLKDLEELRHSLKVD